MDAVRWCIGVCCPWGPDAGRLAGQRPTRTTHPPGGRTRNAHSHAPTHTPRDPESPMLFACTPPRRRPHHRHTASPAPAAGCAGPTHARCRPPTRTPVQRHSRRRRRLTRRRPPLPLLLLTPPPSAGPVPAPDRSRTGCAPGRRPAHHHHLRLHHHPRWCRPLRRPSPLRPRALPLPFLPPRLWLPARPRPAAAPGRWRRRRPPRTATARLGAGAARGCGGWGQRQVLWEVLSGGGAGSRAGSAAVARAMVEGAQGLSHSCRNWLAATPLMARHTTLHSPRWPSQSARCPATPLHFP